MTKRKQLRTPLEVQKTRNALLKEQKGVDPLTKELIPEGLAVLDHDHESQLVRSVLHRQSNVFEGRVVNSYVRSIKWWAKIPLPDLLRNLADYYEKDYSHNPYHPGWMKKLKIEFNKLNEVGKQKVLKELGLQQGNNSTERKKSFAGFLKKETCEFHKVLGIIERNKM